MNVCAQCTSAVQTWGPGRATALTTSPLCPPSFISRQCTAGLPALAVVVNLRISVPLHLRTCCSFRLLCPSLLPPCSLNSIQPSRVSWPLAPPQSVPWPSVHPKLLSLHTSLLLFTGPHCELPKGCLLGSPKDHLRHLRARSWGRHASSPSPGDGTSCGCRAYKCIDWTRLGSSLTFHS